MCAGTRNGLKKLLEEKAVRCLNCNWEGLRGDLARLIPDDITEVCPVCNSKEIQPLMDNAPESHDED